VITVCDTGPIVAYLNRNDPHHGWAVAVMKQVRPPLLTCEAVLTEAVYVLRDDGLDIDPLFRMLERAALLIDFDMSAHWPRMHALMQRYPRMDLSDASIVVMCETHARSQVLTIDVNDFSTYRRNDRRVIPFVAPSPR
jgi:predicted nucleic acid-binding protein